MKSIGTIILLSNILQIIYCQLTFLEHKINGCPEICKGNCDLLTGNCLPPTLSMAGVGGCQAGFWGPNCDRACNVGCNVVQQNCNQKDGTCKFCKVGYVGNSCEECGVTYFGPTCERCPVHCIDVNTCAYGIHGNGTCTGCDLGFAGTNCQNACSLGCDLYQGNCDQTNGNCKCLNGFTGDTCNTCLPGFYGTNCDRCPIHCLNGCDKDTGKCVGGCQPGFYGDTCDNQCSQGCDLTNGVCDQQSGNCTLCKNGFNGTKCDTCVVGSWGPSCEACPLHCQNGCNFTDGSCVNGCQYSFWGDRCQNVCSSGCDMVQGLCDQKTGNCTKCKQNFNGTNCDICQDGMWGPACNKPCSDKCDGVCAKGNGVCPKCVMGYWGDVCHNDCANGCDYSFGNCDQNTGVCTCKKGFTGTNCDTCVPNSYGQNCEVCPSHCNGTCDNASGNCTNGCANGFWSAKCDNECSYGCDSNCDQTTGQCSKCKVGFVGPNCDKCDVGFYGPNCDYCPAHCIGLCDATTGNCPNGCENGFWGNRCQNVCGTGCNLNKQNCDQVTGGCSCFKGYKGTNCLDCDYGYYSHPVCDFCPAHCSGDCDKVTGECIGDETK